MNDTDRRFDRVFEEMRAHREEIRAAIAGLREEMRADLGGLRDEMRADTGELRDAMHAGFGELRGEIAGVRTELHSELHAYTRHTQVLFGGFITALLGLLAAALF